MVRLYISIILAGFVIPVVAQQQSLLSTAGGYSQTITLSVSWSLGETVTETFSNNTYTFNQGFQQSMLEPVGIIDSKKPLARAIEVFPNPTQGLVYIKLNKELISNQNIPDHFTIFNIQGKQLAQGLITDEHPIFDLSAFSGAVYYLRLFNAGSTLQSTVIIQKIN